MSGTGRKLLLCCKRIIQSGKHLIKRACKTRNLIVCIWNFKRLRKILGLYFIDFVTESSQRQQCTAADKICTDTAQENNDCSCNDTSGAEKVFGFLYLIGKTCKQSVWINVKGDWRGISFIDLYDIITQIFDSGNSGVTNKKINSSDKLIALTFDDGPNYNTGKVLDVLAKYNVKATFFVLGSKAKDNKKILKREYDSGMEIGNHTFNHLLLTKYKENVIKDEIDKTSSVIFEVTGRYPKLLRPSYGVYNNIVKKIGNMPIIIWDIDTLDWKYHNSKRIASRVINKVKDGDIILMHDIYSATANSLNIIIPELQNRGYTFVTIPELFYYKEITLEKGMVYGYAR